MEGISKFKEMVYRIKKKRSEQKIIKNKNIIICAAQLLFIITIFISNQAYSNGIVVEEIKGSWTMIFNKNKQECYGYTFPKESINNLPNRGLNYLQIYKSKNQKDYSISLMAGVKLDGKKENNYINILGRKIEFEVDRIYGFLQKINIKDIITKLKYTTELEIILKTYNQENIKDIYEVLETDQAVKFINKYCG